MAATETTEGRTRALLLMGSEMRGAHGASTTRAAVAELAWSLPWLQTTVGGRLGLPPLGPHRPV